MHYHTKISIRTSLLTAVVVAIGCLAMDSTAFAKSKAEKKAAKSTSVSGSISAVDEKSVTIETKKQGSKQFQLTADTTYKLKGKKGSADQAATASDLKVGQHVQVTSPGDKNQTVVIEPKTKEKKKKT